MSQYDPPGAGQSLVEHLVAGARLRVRRLPIIVTDLIARGHAIDWQAAFRNEIGRLPRSALALLVAIGSIPLTVSLGANLLTLRLETDLTRSAAAHEAEQARQYRIAQAFENPRSTTISRAVEVLARQLPDPLPLHAIDSDETGQLRIEIDTIDPDDLRARLRTVPALREFHEIDERPTDSGIRVVLAGGFL